MPTLDDRCHGVGTDWWGDQWALGGPVAARALTRWSAEPDRPTELEGYGPIPASVARRIAAHGVWRRLLTDPRTGALLDYGTTRYPDGPTAAANLGPPCRPHHNLKTHAG